MAREAPQPPGWLRLSLQRELAIGTGKSGDRKESTSRVEEAIGKPSPEYFGHPRF
jgi:hypothetical protein